MTHTVKLHVYPESAIGCIVRHNCTIPLPAESVELCVNDCLVEQLKAVNATFGEIARKA